MSTVKRKKRKKKKVNGKKNGNGNNKLAVSIDKLLELDPVRTIVVPDPDKFEENQMRLLTKFAMKSRENGLKVRVRVEGLLLSFLESIDPDDIKKVSVTKRITSFKELLESLFLMREKYVEIPDGSNVGAKMITAGGNMDLENDFTLDDLKAEESTIQKEIDLLQRQKNRKMRKVKSES